MKQEILNQKLDLHKLWVESKGKEGARAYLRDADLSGANLIGANLIGANLSGADLSGAYLRDADLSGANLIGANLSGANLIGANLSGAYLIGANLIGAYLRGADLRRAILPDSLKFTPDPNLIKKVAETALNAPMCLNMDSWHSSCGTTHCLAGWAVTIHPDGKRLEENSSTYLAGRLLLGDEADKHFFDSNEQAIEWLKTVTTQQHG